jgi:hypothetical protein
MQKMVEKLYPEEDPMKRFALRSLFPKLLASPCAAITGINKSLFAENKYLTTVGGKIPNMPFIGFPIPSAHVYKSKKVPANLSCKIQCFGK